MAKVWFGASAADFTGQGTGGGSLIITTGAVLEVWDAPSGGQRVTDLQDESGNPDTVVTSNSFGLYRFQAEDNHGTLWVQPINPPQEIRYAAQRADVTTLSKTAAAAASQASADAQRAVSGLQGVVRSVNDVRPNADGAVTISAGGGSGATLEQVLAAFEVRRRPRLLDGFTSDAAANTTRFNNFLAAAQEYDTLVLPRGGVIPHDNVIIVPRDRRRVTLDGNGARLVATVPRFGGLRVLADGTTLQRIDHRVDWGSATPTRGNGENFDDCPISAWNCSDVTVEDCYSELSRDASFFFSGVAGLKIRSVHGRASRADGLHFTGGTSHVRASGVVMVDVNDDGVACVDYLQDTPVCRDIRVSDIEVVNGDARGVAIAGGTDVHFSGINIHRCRGTAFYIAQERGGFNTKTVTGASMTAGRSYDANWDSNLDTGHIGIFNLGDNTVMSDILVAGLQIMDGRKSSAGRPYGKIGNNGGGAPERGRFRNVRVRDINLYGGTGVAAFHVDTISTGSGKTVGAFTYAGGGSGTGLTETAEGFVVAGSGNLAAAGTTTAAPGLSIERVRYGGRWAAA